MQFRGWIYVIGCLLAVPTWAQAQDAAQWPEQLSHRNARYAHLDRDQDPSGDARERLLADFVTRRDTDPLGDREVERQALASRHAPPRATTHAEIARTPDAAGDERERFLRTLPTARLHAELRRFRDLRGDEREFAQWQFDRIRHGPLRWNHQGTMLGNTGEFNARRDYREAHQDEIRDREREGQADERRVERQLQQEEEGRARYLTARMRASEREIDRELERDESESESELEREIDELEDDMDDAMDEALDESERVLDKDEARLERDQERDVERQIQQEEENTLEE